MKLDDAYDNLGHIRGAMEFPPRWLKEAAAFREDLKKQGRARLGIPYGDSDRQVFDLFTPEAQSKGVVVFVHGGYWLRFDRTHWSHFAQGALAQSYSVAMPSYDLCPTVRIGDITEQIVRAIEVIAAQTAGAIILTGHSAGGHLVARMAEPGLLTPDAAGRIRRIIPISPVSDLRPLLQTSMNADFQLTEDSAAKESPVLMENRLEIPVSVRVGAEERPAFLDQANWLSTAWGTPLHIEKDKHHLNVINALINPDSEMMRDILS